MLSIDRFPRAAATDELEKVTMLSTAVASGRPPPDFGHAVLDGESQPELSFCPLDYFRTQFTRQMIRLEGVRKLGCASFSQLHRHEKVFT